jgi:glycosyltransferase involved in cell wall biosynthesis
VDSSRNTRQSFSFIRWLIWKETIKRARALDCLSTGIHDNVQKLFGRDHNIFVSTCSFTDIRQAPTNPKPLHERKFDFVFVSRLTPKKGLNFMFESLKCINEELHITIGIFGAGPMDSYVKENILEIKRNKNLTIHKGFASNTFEIFSDAKYFLSLQDLENYPSQSLMEAMTCGCIPIATDVGETRRLVNESTGLLVKTPKELADLINSLARKTEHDHKKSTAASKLIKESYNINIFTSYFDGFLRNRNSQ